MIRQVNAVCLFLEAARRSEQFYVERVGLEVKSTDEGFVELALGETGLPCLEKSVARDMLKDMAIAPKRNEVAFTVAAYADDAAKTYEDLDGEWSSQSLRHCSPGVRRPRISGTPTATCGKSLVSSTELLPVVWTEILPNLSVVATT